jgi:hypothetical protein
MKVSISGLACLPLMVTLFTFPAAAADFRNKKLRLHSQQQSSRYIYSHPDLSVVFAVR